jgi:hypothetical protein
VSIAADRSDVCSWTPTASSRTNPPRERPVAWADPDELPDVDVDLAALDEALAEPGHGLRRPCRARSSTKLGRMIVSVQPQLSGESPPHWKQILSDDQTPKSRRWSNASPAIPWPNA